MYIAIVYYKLFGNYIKLIKIVVQKNINRTVSFYINYNTDKFNIDIFYLRILKVQCLKFSKIN